MSWRRVGKSLRATVAHGLLFSFTLLLVLKLEHAVSYSWWIIFVPFWLFHVVVARGRFSLPAPSMPHDRRWTPFHAVMATPLLVAFELLLRIYLERSYAVNLNIVFLPLLAFQTAILVDNIRSMSDEATWETLPHFWVAISMVFFVAAATFTLLKLCGYVASLGWWDLFITYGVAECFAFLVCKKWYGLVVSSDQYQNIICSLQDIGGHIMKIPLLSFQLLVFMNVEGTSSSARHMPIPVLFSPLLLLQGAGLLFASYRFVEKIIPLRLIWEDIPEYLQMLVIVLGSCIMGQGSREEQARLCYAGASGYDTFSPDAVKKMPKSDLADEEEEVLCRVCFEQHINIVLLPCMHHILCSTCGEKCERCPICRVSIEERLPVYDM